MEHIRNFCIIAHIDHGKSTLADRLLEATGTVEARRMREQVLDAMELERERGITIKMTPVRMRYARGAARYTLNLIDTPGHIDFSYEVSRALTAVEGAVFLVDATQGVQAQTITTLSMARAAGLAVIPAVTKIDAPLARIPEARREVAALVGVPESDVLLLSGRTGAGVPELLSAIVEKVPPPREEFPASRSFRALTFDFRYDNHRGVVLYVRVTDGALVPRAPLRLVAAARTFTPLGVGTFAPEETPAERLSAGEIGYIMTGIKEPGVASVGDTVTLAGAPLSALPGYERAKSVVWAGLYPESQDDFNMLRQALERLRLSDAAFSFEEEASGMLGRGFRAGFLGMLHLEIVAERLRREFGVRLVVTAPSVTYEVVDARGRRIVARSPAAFPEYGQISEVFEPWVSARIITPADYLGPVMRLLHAHEANVEKTETFGEGRISLELSMPLRELMRGFFDELKSVSSGFASLAYRLGELREAAVVRLDVLIADEPVPAFSRIVSERRIEEEAERIVEKLHAILPRQLFVAKIQARSRGRIIASRTLKALRKDVTGYLYGGDRTRKMKLWEKQKRGKAKLRERGRVNIPEEVFLKMVQ